MNITRFMTFHLKICRKPEVLMSFFDCNVVWDIIVSLKCKLRYIHKPDINSFGFFEKVVISLKTSENLTFFPPDMHTYVCISGGNKC